MTLRNNFVYFLLLLCFIPACISQTDIDDVVYLDAERLNRHSGSQEDQKEMFPQTAGGEPTPCDSRKAKFERQMPPGIPSPPPGMPNMSQPDMGGIGGGMPNMSQPDMGGGMPNVSQPDMGGIGGGMPNMSQPDMGGGMPNMSQPDMSGVPSGSRKAKFERQMPPGIPSPPPGMPNMSQPDMGGGMPNMSQPDMSGVSPPSNSRESKFEGQHFPEPPGGLPAPQETLHSFSSRSRRKRAFRNSFNGIIQNTKLRKRRSTLRSLLKSMKLNPTIPGVPGLPGQPDMPSIPKPENNTSNMTQSEIPGVEIPAYSVKLLRLV